MSAFDAVEVTLLVLILLSMVSLPLMDLVRRRDRVHPSWWFPVIAALVDASLLVFERGREDLLFKTDWIPVVVSGSEGFVVFVLSGLLVGLLAARGLAPGRRGDPRPPLQRPPWGPFVSASLVVVLTAWLAGRYSALFVAQAFLWLLPWWWVFGRVPGVARVDEGRGFSLNLMLLWGVALFASRWGLRSLERAPWDVLDLVWLLALAVYVVWLEQLGRPRRTLVHALGVVLLIPVIATRIWCLPDAPVEVPRFVDLDGNPVVLRGQECQDTDEYVECWMDVVETNHESGECIWAAEGIHSRFVRRDPMNTDDYVEWCTKAITPETELRSLDVSEVDRLLVDRGRYRILSGYGEGAGLQLREVGDGVAVGRDAPRPLDALAEHLAMRRHRRGSESWVEVIGHRWTVQQAVSICATAYQAGYRSCRIVAEANLAYPLKETGFEPVLEGIGVRDGRPYYGDTGTPPVFPNW